MAAGAERMRGGVRQRGGRWAYTVYVGKFPAQRCERCKRRAGWLADGAADRCRRCRGPLVERDEWRQESVTGFTTRAAAEAARRAHLVQLDTGTAVPRGSLTVGAWLAEWAAGLEVERAPATARAYRHIVKHIRVSAIAALRLSDLRPTHVAALEAAWLTSGGREGRPLGRRTVQQRHAVLHSALTDAVAAGLLGTNPATRKKRTRTRGGARRPSELAVWTAPHVRAFLAHPSLSRDVGLWTVALGTGMRRAELLGLAWADVDLDAARVRVWRGRVIADGGPRTQEDVKTASSSRELSLDPYLIAALRRHRSAQHAERLAAGPVWQDTGYVFTDPEGLPLHPNTVSARWARAVKAAGLPGIRLHDARHTYATLALSAGVPLLVVSRRLGHATLAITSDLYGHVLRSDDEAAAEAYGRAVWG